MYVDSYEPKTSSTKMNLKQKRKCILSMPVKMSPVFLFKYFQSTCFKYVTKSSNLKLHTRVTLKLIP